MEKEENSLIKKTSKIRKEYIVLIIIGIVIILIDQISKIYINNIGEVTLIPEILKLSITQNTDAAYGIGSNSTVMYVLTNLVILAIIYKFITTQNEFIDTKLKVLLGLVFAGGLSNVIERVIRGYVTEFIDFTPIINIPIFNIADLCVLVGWISMAAIFASFTIKEFRNSKVKKVIRKEDKQKDEDK